MKSLSVAINVLSAMAALVAAYLWWRASVEVVHSNYDGEMPSDYMAFHGGRGPVGMTRGGLRFDVMPTSAL